MTTAAASPAKSRRAVLAAVLLACLLAVLGLALGPARADAHPLSASAVLLDVHPDRVDGQVQLPIDRLAIALDQPLTATTVTQPGTLEQLRQYVRSHTSAHGVGDDAPWKTTIDGGRVENIDGVAHLVFGITTRPLRGAVGDFDFHFDAIVHRLVSHRIFVSSRTTGAEAYTVIGLIDWESQNLTVPVQSASAHEGFVAAIRLGISHIAEGADHLLFLLTLLLPAPLVVRGRKWVPSNDSRRSVFRIVHVVTAFAVGHSITLSLAALGFVSAPARIIESLIALSIVVSGVHALTPIARRGEVWIAGGFGLMHGLAFATLLNQLDLGSTSLLVELIGFNLGIEVMQLVVVVLVMPSLLLLSRTRAYTGVRLAVAGGGTVLAAAWLAERTTLVSTNSLEGIAESLVEHPLAVASVLALAAATAWNIPALRRPPADEREEQAGQHRSTKAPTAHAPRAVP